MGRPKGDGARSKSRPSSSSLAASLVPSGAAAVGFGGYVGSSRVESTLSAEAPTPYVDIDAEVAQHLKRLSRKDPTTKLKALMALSEILKAKSAKEIVPIIPQWAFEYKKLLLDYNREVRRATHDTMTCFVRAVGRDLAPHLKFLMGPWWFSQFDSTLEVSQAAKRSFQAAFQAPDKRLEALMLCTNEIFTYIEENLRLTPQSLSDKVIAADESEEMHQQVISSSLLSLATLLDVLVGLQPQRSGFENIQSGPRNASKARASALAYAEKLFSTQKFFLEFLKSQSPIIRSAAYSLLRSMIKNIPDAVDEGNVRTLAAAILGAFQEKDPTCHSSMWDLVLLFMKQFPDGWMLLNVQKVVLNRFWNFLKKGCYGSQQVSYPALVLFLDAVPPKAVSGEKFFLDFFQNLWEGRSLSHSLNADREAFFLGTKQCILWALRNASRFCNGLDDVNSLQHTLISEVLLKLMWHDYSSPSSSNVIFPSEDGILSNMKTKGNLNSIYHLSYLQDLGICIIEILSGVFSLEHNLLSVFAFRFQDDCLEMFQVGTASGNMEGLTKFLFLLDQHAVQKGEDWPLAYCIGPTLEKTFSLVRTNESPNAVQFMVTTACIFGPQKAVQKLLGIELEAEQFLRAFTDILVPWCLDNFTPASCTKLDLLLALIDDKYFAEQWNIVIMYALNQEGSTDRVLDSKLTALLAMLIEKARGKIKKGGDLQGSMVEHWQHDLLDVTAVSVIKAGPPYGSFGTRFLCALIGGATEDESSFLQENAIKKIFEEILNRFLMFMKDSPFAWVMHLMPLLPLGGEIVDRGVRSSDILQMAGFALEVLGNSLLCIKKTIDESAIVPGILATIYLMSWECKCITTMANNVHDEEYLAKTNLRTSFFESLHTLRSKLDRQYLESISNDSREILRRLLTQSVRCAVLEEDEQESDKFTSLCSLWLVEIMECLCFDEIEEQQFLDELFSGNKLWPSWILPDRDSEQICSERDCSSTNKPGYQRFVTLVNKLISEVGFGKVIAGSVSYGSPSSLNLTENVGYARAWLAAEILCTWEWQRGNALSSFIPLLSTYVKSEDDSVSKILLDSIVTILLEGALLHGADGEISPLNAWSISYEVERVSEPFLRALVAVLYALFHDSVWGRDKAWSYFSLLLDKLFVEDTVDSNCLRILPTCMDVLILHLGIDLDESGSRNLPEALEESELYVTILGWLKRAADFPAFSAWNNGKDMEGWFHLAMSCYPVKATNGMKGLRAWRTISTTERDLLFGLFQKQRHGASAGTNKMLVTQKLLSRLLLVSVAYCWEKFDEDDWEFTLYWLRRWIESAVILVEEIVENINDAVNSAIDDFQIGIKKLEPNVSHLDSTITSLAKNALVSFSLFCDLSSGKDHEQDNHSNPLRGERWELTKDRILECILRLFFSTGLAEAIAGCCSVEFSSVIAASRFEHALFWELVALHVVESSSHARDKAAKSVEMWGLRKGSISSLYAVLFSAKPLPCLQYAAFIVLSTEPLSHLAFSCDKLSDCFDGDRSSNNGSHLPDLASEENFFFREEISFMLEKLPRDVMDVDVSSLERVNVFLAWALLLSHLISLSTSSPSRERTIQYIQDSCDPTILQCLFQHILGQSLPGASLKRKDFTASATEATKAAKHAIVSSSLLSFVESLWPIREEKITSLTGAMYGLMLCILPAYVREWFGSIRDRSRSSAVESFTKTWCSPTLIMNELNRIKKAEFVDDNFSLSVSKSAHEVVATYTKDETRMDLLIRLPASYPLRPVDVDCTRALGVSEITQRKWLMSMVSFVRNQNGALAEAIRVWKSNFDKAFEGVEECPICYSVIHTANNSLPRLACKTCKHKYHSACLYKWFSTSHKSTCPLCQSPF